MERGRRTVIYHEVSGSDGGCEKTSCRKVPPGTKYPKSKQRGERTRTESSSEGVTFNLCCQLEGRIKIEQVEGISLNGPRRHVKKGTTKEPYENEEDGENHFRTRWSSRRLHYIVRIRGEKGGDGKSNLARADFDCTSGCLIRDGEKGGNVTLEAKANSLRRGDTNERGKKGI